MEGREAQRETNQQRASARLPTVSTTLRHSQLPPRRSESTRLSRASVRIVKRSAVYARSSGLAQAARGENGSSARTSGVDLPGSGACQPGRSGRGCVRGDVIDGDRACPQVRPLHQGVGFQGCACTRKIAFASCVRRRKRAAPHTSGRGPCVKHIGHGSSAGRERPRACVNRRGLHLTHGRCRTARRG